MQYVACRQSVSTGGAHFAGRATYARAQLRQLHAFGQQRGPGRTMDRAVDTATTEQRSLAALTIASTARVVMSPCQLRSSCVRLLPVR
ncbi:hypothetical protein VM57_15870 [Stenotrophomonas maltophilia]|uniref:Uncharacterized protein n=1 Tax=Stenotrophomonas maltophilia TaxID=40324 RepID=A0A0F5ZNQ4_STEMA|nr:hypothetical protein VM57_15870 [Stenotrophomonas maltophilia]